MEIFTQNLNLYYPTIKYTYKHKEEGHKRFLDLFIKKVGGKFNFGICQKTKYMFRYISKKKKKNELQMATQYDSF